ncbi:hypothetical protein SCUCBS95973_009916 [Sporothrix curviconia]|uniref:Helicase ATP-binding domain-containing protein n=1 Tax=Sporothrix curviconia TaxID=1260050 RepID=A0ABP0CZ18_9PEZI
MPPYEPPAAATVTANGKTLGNRFDWKDTSTLGFPMPPWFTREWINHDRPPPQWKEEDEKTINRDGLTAEHNEMPLANQFRCLLVINAANAENFTRVAAYAGFQTLDHFFSFLDTEAASLIGAYGRMREKNFTHPTHKYTNDRLCTTKEFFGILGAARVKDGLGKALAAVQPNTVSLIPVSLVKGDENTLLCNKAFIVAATSTLLRFATTGATNKPLFSPTDTDAVLGYSVEDWYRAFGLVLAFFARRMKNKNLFQRKGNKKELGPVPMLAPRDARGVLARSDKDAVPENIATRAELKALAKRLPSMQDERGSELADALRRIGAALPKDEPARPAMPAAKAKPIVPKPKPYSAAAHLPPIDDATLQTFALVLRELANPVSHAKEAATAQTVQALQSQADRLAMLSEASDKHEAAVAVNGLDEQKGEQTLAEVASVSRLLNETAGETVTLQRALHILQIAPEDTNNYTQFHLPLSLAGGSVDSPPPSLFSFAAHQLVDAATVASRLNKLGVALLASETGTGKTAVYLLVLYILCQNNTTRVHRPHLVVVPAATLVQTFHEIKRVTSGYFKVLVYYGRPEAFADNNIRDCVVQTPELEKKLARLAEASDEEETARTIVLTTYTTSTKRQLRTDKPVRAKKAADAANPNSSHAEDEEADEDEDEATAAVSNATLLAPLANASFGVMVLDEAQFVRREYSTYWWIASLVRKQHLLLASATPFLNRVQDAMGAMSLFTDHMGIRFAPPSTAEDRALLASDSFDTDAAVPDWGRLFGKARLQEAPGLASVRRLYDKTKKRAWLCNAALLEALGQDAG